MEYRLTTPCTVQDLAPLRAGDTVLLSGVVYTARDQAHKRMTEALDKGETLPFDLEGSAIYYVGPTPERPGEVIGSAGPTTSGRMVSECGATGDRTMLLTVGSSIGPPTDRL